jgi:XTP/dITP diphosphohydrolase
MHTIVIATGNENKHREIKELLNDPEVEFKSAAELNLLGHLKEDGNTFEENALQKARAIHNATGLPVIADDSGLEVFFLNHRPGVRSARYAGENATDEENNKKLLNELGALSQRRRTARFRSVIAFVADGIEEVAVGDCHGNVLEKPRGTGGFGYDPLFKPNGYDETFAEMTPEQKNIISHRAKSLQKIKPVILNWLKTTSRTTAESVK